MCHLHDFDIVECNTNHTSRDLGETGGVALSGALSAAEHRRAPVGMNGHARAFVPGTPEPHRPHRHRRSDATAFGNGGEADTKITALLAELCLSLAQLGIACQCQRRIHVSGIISRIEGQPGR